MPQQQTSVTALLKHRSHLLHFMVNSQLDPTCELALIFDKAACQHSGDKRKMVHPCHFVTSNAHGGQNSWFSSSVSDSGSIGPCPLIRVSEMVGYDPDSRPGAAARGRADPWFHFGYAFDSLGSYVIVAFNGIASLSQTWAGKEFLLTLKSCRAISVAWSSQTVTGLFLRTLFQTGPFFVFGLACSRPECANWLCVLVQILLASQKMPVVADAFHGPSKAV